jgi:outer membrane immunogenic protein
MKRLLVVGVLGAFAISACSADAADLGVRPAYKAAPSAAPVPIFSWTGCYLGGHIGGGWGRETVSAPALAPGVSVSGDTSGVLGGGQVGCNYQFASNWVIGIEGDGSAADVKGSITDTIFGITGTANAKTEWLASVTGRIGWTWDRWLIYAKGGAAWAGDKYSAEIPIFSEHLEGSETRSGWTVGGGVEWAFWNNWSAKAEYAFYDFGTRGVSLVGTFAGIPEVVPGIQVKQTISAAKFGINYRFGI